MSLNESHLISSIKGHEYRIGFSSFDIIKLPESINKTIVEVVIAIGDNKGINNSGTLFSFAKIIRSYVRKHDVILYCYCDTKEIERSKLHLDLTPQEYRSSLFQKLFDKFSGVDFISKTIKLSDFNGNQHIIHLISRTENEIDMDNVLMEINRLRKQ